MADALHRAHGDLFCDPLLETAFERASKKPMALRGRRPYSVCANRDVGHSRSGRGNQYIRLNTLMASLSKQERYRKLPGRSRPIFAVADAGQQRLWLGPDHILNVRSAWSTESHRQYQLKDIQAITVTGTDRGRNLNFILGIVAAILSATTAYLLVGIPGNAFAATLGVIAGLAAAVCVVYLLSNVLQGKTCVCRLYTAVQTQELRSLGRIRTANRFLDIVKPLIDVVQGPVSEEMLQAQELDSLQASQHAKTKKQSTRQENLYHSEGKVHMALFVLLLFSGLDVLSLMMFSFPERRILDFSILTAAFAVNVVALIKQNKSDLPGPVRGIAWSSLIVLGIMIYGVAIIASIFYLFQELQIQEATSFSLPQGAWFLAITVISGATMILLGVLGIADLLRFRRAHGRLMAAQPTAERPAEETND